MSIFFEILFRKATYGPQIDQLHGENRLSHIINYFSKIQLVVYYQCWILIGWATTRLYVIAH